MLVSIGGSISTGSTPWIDIISSYDRVNVLPGEMRLGESGLYNILSKLFMNTPPSLEEYHSVETALVGYGQAIPIALQGAFSLFVKMPGTPAKLRSNISRYRLRKRGYNKRLPGFSLCTNRMLKKLLALIEHFSTYDNHDRRERLISLVDEYLCTLGNLVSDKKNGVAVVDQLVPPRLLFDESYGPEVFNNINKLKVIVVRRDPRDQFIDMLVKNKKRYNIMSADEAARVYVNQYLPRYDRMQIMLKNCDSSKVLDIWFEDIFYDFEKALDKVESFIGLQNRPDNFDDLDFSEVSKKVGLYKSAEFSRQVDFIKGSMRNHLYY